MATVVDHPEIGTAFTPAITAAPLELLSGLGAPTGSDFRQSLNQLVFAEYSAGKISALNLFSPAMIVSSGSTILKGTYTFDLDAGVQGGPAANVDIWWDQQTDVLRQMVPRNHAGLLNLGVVNYAGITANHLELLPYAAAPIPANNDASNKLVPGDVFAVRTNKGNFAKVHVLTYGYNLKIEWTTYQVSPGYVPLGAGYTTPEDVKLSMDGAHAYVTERTGDMVRVALSNANRTAATFVVAGMIAPQQIALDELHNAAYVVEYAAPGRLWRINLTTGVKVAVLSHLNLAVGLALSSDLQFAYITEMTSTPNLGCLNRYRLSDGAGQTVVAGLTNPFFLTWADAAHTSLYVPERDPANRVSRIDVTSGARTVVSGTSPRPSSVAMAGSFRMLVCCAQTIDSIPLTPFAPTGPLFLAVGFVPFNDITSAGLADTSADPGAHFPVKDAPFGGLLPLMVNHQRAANDGAAYYRIKIDGVVRLDPWTDDKWNGSTFQMVTMHPLVINSQPGYFPVRPVSDLLLWLHPTLGMLTDSTNLSNGTHNVQMEFFNATGTLMEISNTVTIRVDNRRCAAMLSAPTLNGNSADPVCGVLHYTGVAAMPVEMPVVGTHPAGFATYSFLVVKGVNPVIGINGPVPATSPVSSPASSLLAQFGNCTIAAFGEYLYVAATATNGWSRQCQYDASDAVAFYLAP